jgi:fermentation-respiration switch protein FrsA (DUF1100 family)
LHFSECLNVNVLAYDYEGYGLSDGDVDSLTEEKCYESIEAAFDFLVNVKDIDSHSIILYGRSLGSGPSCYLMEKLAEDNVKIGGLILQSPICSIFRVALDLRMTLPYDMFANVDRIDKAHCPVLIIHGTRDEIVPFWNGEKLWSKIPIKFRARPYWILGGGHNNLEYYRSEPDNGSDDDDSDSDIDEDHSFDEYFYRDGDVSNNEMKKEQSAHFNENEDDINNLDEKKIEDFDRYVNFLEPFRDFLTVWVPSYSHSVGLF